MERNRERGQAETRIDCFWHSTATVDFVVVDEVDEIVVVVGGDVVVGIVASRGPIRSSHPRPHSKAFDRSPPAPAPSHYYFPFFPFLLSFCLSLFLFFLSPLFLNI